MKRFVKVVLPLLLASWVPLACKTPGGAGDMPASTVKSVGTRTPVPAAIRLSRGLNIEPSFETYLESFMGPKAELCFGEVAGRGYGLLYCDTPLPATLDRVVTLTGEPEYQSIPGCKNCNNFYYIYLKRDGVRVGVAVRDLDPKTGAERITLHKLCNQEFEQSCGFDFDPAAKAVLFELWVEGDEKLNAPVVPLPQNPYYSAYVAKLAAEKKAEEERKAAEARRKQEEYDRNPLNRPFWQQAKTDEQKFYAGLFVAAQPLTRAADVRQGEFTCSFLDGREAGTYEAGASNTIHEVLVNMFLADQIATFSPFGQGTFDPEMRIETAVGAPDQGPDMAGTLWVRATVRDGLYMYVMVEYEKTTRRILRYGKCV